MPIVDAFDDAEYAPVVSAGRGYAGDQVRLDRALWNRDEVVTKDGFGHVDSFEVGHFLFSELHELFGRR